MPTKRLRIAVTKVSVNTTRYLVYIRINSCLLPALAQNVYIHHVCGDAGDIHTARNLLFFLLPLLLHFVKYQNNMLPCYYYNNSITITAIVVVAVFIFYVLLLLYYYLSMMYWYGVFNIYLVSVHLVPGTLRCVAVCVLTKKYLGSWLLIVGSV